MIKYKVANRYSQALFEVGLENKNLEKLLSDLEIFSEIFTKSKEFKIIMETSAVSREEKKAIIEELAKKFNFDPMTINFFKLLIDKNKIKFITTITEVFRKKYRDYVGIADYEVISAIDLDSKIINEIKKKLEEKTGKKIEIKSKVEPEIIGGLIVKTEGLIYDGSLKSHLLKIKEKILKG